MPVRGRRSVGVKIFARAGGEEKGKKGKKVHGIAKDERAACGAANY